MKNHIKTYEGVMILKWCKNDRGDYRPFTFDCKNENELKKELTRIKKAFMEKGDDPSYRDYKGNIPPYSVKFEIAERK